MEGIEFVAGEWSPRSGGSKSDRELSTMLIETYICRKLDVQLDRISVSRLRLHEEVADGAFVLARKRYWEQDQSE